MNRRSIRLLPLLMLLLAGCSTTPPSRFYVLTAQPAVEQKPATSSLVVGVGPVRLVAYLERPQIVAWESANQIKVEEFDRWGGTLEDNITWVMAENLSHALGSSAVVSFPWERAVLPEYQVAIDVRRFDPSSDNRVYLSAQWRILGDDGRELRAIENSTLNEPLEGSGFAAQAAAQSRALGRLSDAIAAKILELEARR